MRGARAAPRRPHLRAHHRRHARSTGARSPSWEPAGAARLPLAHRPRPGGRHRLSSLTFVDRRRRHDPARDRATRDGTGSVPTVRRFRRAEDRGLGRRRSPRSAPRRRPTPDRSCLHRPRCRAIVIRRAEGVRWPRTGTTSSSSVPAARVRRPRCCSPARATACSSSTGRRSRATRSRRTSSTRRASPRSTGGACSTGCVPRAARRSTPTRSTSARSRSPAPRAPPTRRSRTARGAPCSTSSSSTRPSEAGAEVREAFTVEEIVDRRRAGHRHPRATARAASRSPSTATVVVGADGRYSLVAEGGRARAVQREAADPLRLLHVLERPAGRRPLRGVRPARTADGRWRRPTTI